MNSMKTRFSPALLSAAALFLSAVSSAVHAQTVVCVETNLDTFCMELLEKDAPKAAVKK